MKLEEYITTGATFNAARDGQIYDAIKDYEEIKQRGVYRGHKCLKALVAYKSGATVYANADELYLKEIEHSTRPNCELKDGSLIAKKNIEADEHLTIKYAES